MADIYALVDSNGLVQNTVIWDGGSDWSPPTGFEVIQIDTVTPRPGVGWTYSGGTWTPPSPPAPTPDPISFGVAIFNDSTITSGLSLSMWIPVLEQQIADPALVAAAWAKLVAQYQISHANQVTIAGYAATYAIPGITVLS